jgi:hypothetical protein
MQDSIQMFQEPKILGSGLIAFAQAACGSPLSWVREPHALLVVEASHRRPMKKKK